MKTYILKLIVLCAVVMSSCTDEELSMKSNEGVPNSIIIDDFNENDELFNTTTFTYSDGTLASVLWERAQSSWSTSDEYTYQNGLVQTKRAYVSTESEFIVNYFYDDSERLIRMEFTNEADTINVVYEYQYVTDTHIIDLVNNREFFLTDDEPFRVEKIIRGDYQQLFNYTNDVVSSIEHRYGDELQKLEEFEYLDLEVSDSYNKLQFLYGPQWKLNALLSEGYSHQLEEKYITKHSVSLSSEEEWTFSYEFDSLDRVSNQYLSFEATDRTFSCMTYYNY